MGQQINHRNGGGHCVVKTCVGVQSHTGVRGCDGHGLPHFNGIYSMVVDSHLVKNILFNRTFSACQAS